MKESGKSITAVTLDEFIDMLYECGWRCPCDAQYSRIQELYNNLYILKTSDYKVDIK